MARKPNYSFERQERDRAKAGKKADKAELKRRQREWDRAAAAGETPPDTAGQD